MVPVRAAVAAERVYRHPALGERSATRSWPDDSVLQHVVVVVAPLPDEREGIRAFEYGRGHGLSDKPDEQRAGVIAAPFGLSGGCQGSGTAAGCPSGAKVIHHHSPERLG